MGNVRSYRAKRREGLMDFRGANRNDLESFIFSLFLSRLSIHEGVLKLQSGLNIVLES